MGSFQTQNDHSAGMCWNSKWRQTPIRTLEGEESMEEEVSRLWITREALLSSCLSSPPRSSILHPHTSNKMAVKSLPRSSLCFWLKALLFLFVFLFMVLIIMLLFVLIILVPCPHARGEPLLIITTLHTQHTFFVQQNWVIFIFSPVLVVNLLLVLKDFILLLLVGAYRW